MSQNLSGKASLSTASPPNRIDRLALADDAHYNHLRHEVLRFLYEKQRKVENIPAAEKKVAEEKKSDARASETPTRRAVGSDL